MAEPNPSPAASPEKPVNLHPKRIDPETAPRPRIKELEVMVAEVIRETGDAATLVLFTGNDRLEYQPGHFLTIKPQQFPALDRFCKYFEDLKGKKANPPWRPWRTSACPTSGSTGRATGRPRVVPLASCRVNFPSVENLFVR